MDQSSRYDALIVGAGIAGSALAYALSTVSRPTGKPFRVALLERSLSEPDRMTGELLQPGGVIALHDLGLEACLENVDDTLLYGYHIYDNGKSAHFPFPKGYHGRSFRHGRFVMNLREAAIKAKGVEVIEASVSQLLEHANRVIGVRATRKRPCSDGSFFADLVFIADGGFSRFRTAVLVSKSKPHTVSHFVGTILEDTILPYPNHGMVALVHGSGPVLLYQIGQKDTRMLVDLKIPLPKDFKAHILDHVLPQLPQTLHQSIRIALENKRLRRMPNSFLPPVRQGSPDGKRGVILIGDAWNMRHPLTGGGMTVALHDVVLLRGLLSHVDDLTDWDRIRQILYQWHWRRKPLAATINILSASLHNVCAADNEELDLLRTGCFKYLERGGEYVNGPASLFSAVTPSLAVLAYHLISLAIYTVWILFTHPRSVSTPSGEKLVLQVARMHEYPPLLIKSIRTVWVGLVMIGPLVWSEMRW